jgi:hypothetical protein
MRFPFKCAFTACTLLLFALFALSSEDSQRAAAGEHYRHHGGGGGASDRDQRTILDPEYGIGLFTRYLIEGLAGRADEAPIGNGDKRIDTVEL